jgi:hypothetical protein
MAVDLDKLAGPDGGQDSRRLAKHWMNQIDQQRDNSEIKRWYKRGDTIEKRYRDERNRVDEEGQRRYNSLWSNTEILRPALYGRTPLPIVERRFKDRDPVGRNAAGMLERALRNEIEINGFHMALLQAVDDYLLPGRGTVWVRYEPEIEEGVSLPPETETDMRDSSGRIDLQQQNSFAGTDTSEPRDRTPDEIRRSRPSLDEDGKPPMPPEQDAEEVKLRTTGDRVVRESVPVDYLPWQDFYTLPTRARTWAEVTVCAKRIYMSRDQMRRRFGKKIADRIPLIKDDRGQRVQYTTPMQALEDDKGQIFEIWNRADTTVYWVAHGYEFLCDRKEDPLRLENFFPCPRPLYANPTNTTLVPVPDYIQYQDQAIQIDELTQRIAMLTRACKIAGVYNAAAKSMARLFNESVENELIPVEDWAAFGKEGGGIEGNWSLMPVQEIIAVINELIQARQKVMEDMDRLTGISDIMRGTSDARETLGGVRLKHNTTGTRLTSRQNEIARFARDTVRLMANVMAEHFSPQSLIEASGALYEEGLGPKDMPDLTALQGGGTSLPSPTQAAPPLPPQQQPPTPGQPPLPTPQAAPGAPPAGAGPPLPGSAQLPPPPQPQQGGAGPLGPQGVPPPQPPQMGAPAATPGPMGGMPSPMPPPMQGQVLPPIDPKLQAQFDALKRIADAIQLLRDEKLRGFRIDIEVDSTIFPDAAQEKQDRTEFIAATTKFLQESMLMGQQLPEAVPLLGKLLQFGVRGYKVGRDLEAAIEDFCDQAPQIIQQKMQQASQQPNPEMLKAQAAMEKTKGQMQIAREKHQAGMQKVQADAGVMQMKTQAEQQKGQAEVQHEQLQQQGEQAQAQAEVESKQMDIQIKKIEQQMQMMQMMLEQMKLKMEMQMGQQEMAQDQQHMQHEQSMDQQHMVHEQNMAQHQAQQAERQAQQRLMQPTMPQRPGGM